MAENTQEQCHRKDDETLEGRKGIVLLSDGFDSPVAAHMMMQRGMQLRFLHCPLTKDVNRKVHTLMQHLARATRKELTLTIIPIREAHAAFARVANRRFQCIFCKRLMMRIAERLMEEEHKEGYLVTGDNLGQVASQTVQNMALIDRAVRTTILRPLLGFDKQEILDRAKRIGTHDISAQKAPQCPFVPPNPHTMAQDEHVRESEERLDITGAIEEAMEGRRDIPFSP